MSSRQRSAEVLNASGHIPGEDAISCPSLTNVGPSRPNAVTAPSASASGQV
jgi:hypothetical protein